MRAIFDPRMMPAVKEYFRHLCTIEVRSDAQNTFGEANPTWVELRNHQRIPCVVAPLPGQATATEVRRLDGTVSIQTHQVLLRGYYPAITDAHRANIDGTTYNIMGVEPDSHRETTRLRVEVVR